MFNWLISDDSEGIDFQIDKEKIHQYEATTISHFKVNEMTMNKTENNYLFEVSVIGKVKEGYVFDWLVKGRKLFKGMEYLGEHLSVLERLAGVKDHLRLLIDKDGLISRVLNKDEIQNRWLEIRENLYEHPEEWPIDEQYKTRFIKDGDLEHGLNFPVEDVLNQDPLFSTFFFQNTKNKTKEGDDALIRTEQPSNLLMSENTEKFLIPVLQSTCWRKNESQKDLIDFIISRNADKGKLNKSRMGKLLKNFPFAEQELKSYVYACEAEYQIQESSFMIMEAKYNLLEKVNLDLEINHFCGIKLIC